MVELETMKGKPREEKKEPTAKANSQNRKIYLWKFVGIGQCHWQWRRKWTMEDVFVYEEQFVNDYGSWRRLSTSTSQRVEVRSLFSRGEGEGTSMASDCNWSWNLTKILDENRKKRVKRDLFWAKMIEKSEKASNNNLIAYLYKEWLIFHETWQIFQLRFVGHTFLSDSELELTSLTFELPFAPAVQAVWRSSRVHITAWTRPLSRKRIQIQISQDEMISIQKTRGKDKLAKIWESGRWSLGNF